jgi:CheY-like chemotaxis protein
MSTRILFVEDNANTAMAMKVVLELRGYNVETAKNVAEAVAKLEANSYDLLISDISLPDGTGYDVIARSPKRVKAIGLSGYTSETDKEEAMRRGFSEYLTKPFRNDDLFGAIERLTS